MKDKPTYEEIEKTLESILSEKLYLEYKESYMILKMDGIFFMTGRRGKEMFEKAVVERFNEMK